MSTGEADYSELGQELLVVGILLILQVMSLLLLNCSHLRIHTCHGVASWCAENVGGRGLERSASAGASQNTLKLPQQAAVAEDSVEEGTVYMNRVGNARCMCSGIVHLARQCSVNVHNVLRLGSRPPTALTRLYR